MSRSRLAEKIRAESNAGLITAFCAIRSKKGRRLTSDPIQTSLGLLPSGPDPVGEWLVPPQSPRPYLGPKGAESKRGEGPFAGLVQNCGKALVAVKPWPCARRSRASFEGCRRNPYVRFSVDTVLPAQERHYRHRRSALVARAHHQGCPLSLAALGAAAAGHRRDHRPVGGRAGAA